jgi:hypothetical protein
MARRQELTKVVDETTRVRCNSGMGIIREEVWTGKDNRIAKYNLTFIHHRLSRMDNGRVLGYDNAHGVHERHCKGEITIHAFTTYEALVETFLEEVRVLKGR